MQWAAELESLGLLALAGLLGGLVGLERELAQKPAGLRTHIFVGMAACLLMLLGGAVIDTFQKQERTDILRVDPIRVIEAIVVGISFLGAGTIIHEGGKRGKRVEGLTTAASVLLTAAVGIAVAAEKIVLAVGVTLLAVLVLYGVVVLERKMGKFDHPEADDSRPDDVPPD